MWWPFLGMASNSDASREKDASNATNFIYTDLMLDFRALNVALIQFCYHAFLRVCNPRQCLFSNGFGLPLLFHSPTPLVVESSSIHLELAHAKSSDFPHQYPQDSIAKQ